MSFDTDVVKPSRGRVIRVDVSSDSFATVIYRWGDKAGKLDGTNMYSSRVLSLGQVRRGLGQNRIAASTTTSLSLDNADGALDALCGSTGLALAAALRFRVYVVLYEAGADFSPVSKLLGEFSLSSWPQQNDTTVELALADDFMGRLGPGLRLPTISDWVSVGTPLVNLNGLPVSLSSQTPIQLAFGEDWLLAHPHIIPIGSNGAGQAYGPDVTAPTDPGRIAVIVPLYCTTDLSAVSQDLVQQLRVEMVRIPSTLDSEDGVPELRTIPRTAWRSLGGGAQEEVTIWRVEKSPTITKDGRDYQVVYLVVRTYLAFTGVLDVAVGENPDGTLNIEDFNARRAQLEAYKYQGGYSPDAVTSAGEAYAQVTSRVLNWYVKGTPLSQRTNANTPTSSTLGNFSHAVDVMTDLVSEYSDATVDATSASRVKGGVPFASCAGVVQAWSERANNANIYQPPLSLRQVLTMLAQSSDIDIFVSWDGDIAFASDVYDYLTATQSPNLITFREEEISSVKRWVPSDGERNAAFNRVYMEGGKRDPAEAFPGNAAAEMPFQGPFDIPDATIPVTTRIIEVPLQQGWRPSRQQRLNPMQWRNLDPVARDRISFRTHLGGLRLELGDYFKVTWTRGADIGGPYQSTVFQCEAITYAPGDDTVELEGVWRDDTVTERQYLLDDETLLIRPKFATSGSATGDENGNVLFGGTIDLTTMGVEVGDILVYRLTSEAGDAFLYNCCFRIDDVIDATNINVLPWDGSVFPGLTAVPNAEWYIVRGATTYYPGVDPDFGTIYGKVTNAAGEHSNSETGNRLING